ncbi:MAG: hypothetical protein U0359_20995 [Byssovorax sp.]
MSMHQHATISAWQREEDGSYKADLDGWELVVSWRPESASTRRGFFWEAKKGEEHKVRSRELHEEIELAMVAAEKYAKAWDAGAAAREAAAAESDHAQH